MLPNSHVAALTPKTKPARQWPHWPPNHLEPHHPTWTALSFPRPPSRLSFPPVRPVQTREGHSEVGSRGVSVLRAIRNGLFIQKIHNMKKLPRKVLHQKLLTPLCKNFWSLSSEQALEWSTCGSFPITGMWDDGPSQPPVGCSCSLNSQLKRPLPEDDSWVKSDGAVSSHCCTGRRGRVLKA